jgi:nucleoside-triphosphatase THEP1
MNSAKIVVITGEIESGKTSFCLKVAELAKESGYGLTGVVSPGVFHKKKKIAIDLMNITTGERRRLAELRGESDSGLDTKRWSFESETVLWGNEILRTATASDLLIIDELGPLEFTRSQGLMMAFDSIKRGDYQTALLVIRPSLVHQAYRRWDIDRLLDLSGSGPFPRSVEDFLESLDFQP